MSERYRVFYHAVNDSYELLGIDGQRLLVVYHDDVETRMSDLADLLNSLTDRIAELEEIRGDYIEAMMKIVGKATTLTAQLAEAKADFKMAETANEHKRIRIDRLTAENERLEGLVKEYRRQTGIQPTMIQALSTDKEGDGNGNL